MVEAGLHSLGKIVIYIARDKPLLAESFRREVFHRAGLLADFPRLGRIVPEFSDPNRRELLYGDYRLIFRVKPRLKRIQILLIIHGKRILRH
jgi:plasmid stabilization system protein ParE